jgi:peptidyl-prolyl cis-trans isomerase C
MNGKIRSISFRTDRITVTMTHTATSIGSAMLPILLLLMPTAACEKRSLPSDKQRAVVLASVNGNLLLKEDFEILLPEDYEKILTGDEMEGYLDRWITTELLYQAALKDGFQLTHDIEMRMENLKKELIADRFLQKIIQKRATVSEEEARAYYKAHEREYTKEFRVSHILLDTPEEASGAKEDLKSKSFAWVARRRSRDKHTGIGGDLGYLSKGNMIPAFEDVVFDMEEGEISDVIPSEFGYHIIMLTSVRDARNILRFDDVREEIANILMRKKRGEVYDSLVTSLRANAAIEMLDDQLGWRTEEVPEEYPDTMMVDSTLFPEEAE